MEKSFFILPFIPLFTRLCLIIRYRKLMKHILEEDELDRDAHRNYIMVLTGFSFTGLLTTVLLESTVINGFFLTIYYLFISFLFFLSALNFQGYKARRWQDQISTSFSEIASLSLILSVISVLFIKNINISFSIFLTFLSSIVWFSDHIYRLFLQSNYLKMKGNKNEKSNKSSKR